MWQQQQPLRAKAFGFLSVGDRLAGRTTDTGENRDLARAGIDGGLDDIRIFLGGQRKELAGAAGSEECRCAIRRQPFQPLDVPGAVEVALRVEIGDRERQQARREDGFQFLWIHCSSIL